MSPMIVRIGGILVFLSIAAGIAAIAVYLAATTGWEAETDPVVRERSYRSAIKTKGWIYRLGFILVPAALAAVFWTTWGFFRALDHKATKAPTIAIAIFATLGTALSAISWTFGNTAVGIMAFLFSLLLPILGGYLFIPLLIWFSIAVFLFGRDADSLLWKAVGIVYLAGAITAGTLLVWRHADWGPIADPLIAVVGAIAVGGWVCHGSALILSAGRMALARSAEAVVNPLGGPSEPD